MTPAPEAMRPARASRPRRLGVSTLRRFGGARSSVRGAANGGTERQYGMHLAAHLLWREASGRQFDGERGRAGQVVVLPVGGGAVEPGGVVEVRAGSAGVDAAGGGGRSPGRDEGHVVGGPEPY